MSWTLKPAPRGHILAPPGADPRKDVFVIKAARSARNFLGSACTLETNEVSLQWRGHDAKFRANVVSLAPLPGSLATATRPDGSTAPLGGQTVITSNWFEEILRPALQKQVTAGCLTAAELAALDRRLIDHLALPSAALYRLRFGEFTLNGYVDVTDQFRLRTVEPVREHGAVIGYLTSFYLLAKAPDGGVLVSAGDSETNIQARLTAGKASDSELLHLPAGATWLRLFFRTWSSTQDRRIALIAAPSAAERERASREFEADPEGYCAGAAKTRGVACVSVPEEMVLGPELRVFARGSDAFAPVGGTLNDVLRGAGLRDPKTALATLQVLRPYEGKLVPINFDRTKTEILGLVLIGGEQITW
ncbi:MAG: hypothetical protein IPP47_03995 [Bryobacterales bacterium]|nr:hypothetical protein [Bryobacterales bacterium]